MKGGDVHYFPVPIKAGEYCEITVEQKGIDVVIELVGPDGSRRGEIDGFTGAAGLESTFVAAEEAGQYRLEIRALEPGASPGTYIVTTERRTATQEDHARDLASRIARARSETEVDALIAKQRRLVNFELTLALHDHLRESYSFNIPRTQILFASQQLLRIAGQVNDERAIAWGYRSLGNAHGNLGRYDVAIENLQQAIEIFERVGHSWGLAHAWFDSGVWHRNKGDFKKALEYFQKSASNYLGLGAYVNAVRAQQQVASGHVALNNFPEAYRVLERSMRILETHEDAELKFGALMQLGSVFEYEGRHAKSIESNHAAYAVAEKANQRSGMASSAYALAMSYKEHGNLIAAYSYFSRASSLFDSLGNSQRSTGAIINIAELFERIGRRQQAIELYELAIKRTDVQIGRAKGYVQRGYTGDKADVLVRIAVLKLSERDLVGALAALQQAASLLDSLVIGPETNQRISLTAFEWYRAVRAKTHKAAGDVYVAMKRHSDAKLEHTKALELAESLKYERGIVEALIGISSAADAEGDHARSIEYSVKAVNFLKARKMGERARIYTNLGRAYRNLKNVTETERAFGEAIRIAETLRSDTAVKDLGATYTSALLEPFDEYIEFLMEMHGREPSGGFDRKAFEISERRRSRALLDALKDARSGIRNGGDPELLEEENRILNRINTAARAKDPFSDTESELLPTPEHPEAGLLTAPDIDIALLISEHKRIQTAIRARSPKLASLTQPEPANLAAIDALLDTETIVLNYALGENRSYLWAISKGAVTSHVLPSRTEIEDSAKKVYKYLSDGASADSAEAKNEYDAEAARLSKAVLGPVSALLGKKRIVIVADGALQYVPFASLPDPSQAGSVPLLASNEVVFAPSLSVVGVLRSESANRAAPVKSVAIFADPVFSENDERLTMKPEAGRAEGENLTRSLLFPKSFGSENPERPYVVPRLPFSKQEGDAIFGTAVPGTAALWVSFDASRERAINRELSDFKIVHFATHGVLNSELPELSGLILSLVNRKGEQVNGFLRLNEIYNMELNADLVVLSACETALGKEVRGEGLIGLTRGFMYAGSPRVVASLWKVDDVATAEFMKIFYQKMLIEKKRPAAALTSTKLEMGKSKRWSAPYYWAAFELHGDWN